MGATEADDGRKAIFRVDISCLLHGLIRYTYVYFTYQLIFKTSICEPAIEFTVTLYQSSSILPSFDSIDYGLRLISLCLTFFFFGLCSFLRSLILNGDVVVLGARFAAVGAMPLLTASTATTEEEDGDADEEDGGRDHHDDDPGVDITHSADDTSPDLRSQRMGLGVEYTLELPPEENAENRRTE